MYQSRVSQNPTSARKPQALPAPVIGLMLLLSVVAFTGRVLGQTMTWIQTAGGGWNTPGNWNPNNVPNQAGESALVPNDTFAYTINLDVSPSLDAVTMANPAATLQLFGLTLTVIQPAGLDNSGRVVANAGSAHIQGAVFNRAGGVIDISSGQLLYLTGPTLTNDGTINVNFEGSSLDAHLRASTTDSLNLLGTGTIVLKTAGDPADAQISAYSGVWIQGPAHTIRGEGTIGAPLISAGTIRADVPGRALVLSNSAKTNTGLIKAIAGGILRLSGITLTQTDAGQLLADAGMVELSGTGRVQGGTLATANDGFVQCVSGSFYLRDCTSLGRLDLPGGAGLYVEGSGLTNNGTINLNSDASSTDTSLRSSISTIAHLSGTGEIVMRTAGDPADAQIPQYYGTWSQEAGHTIHGEGTIGAQLANAGSVIADVSGRALVLSTSAKSNTGLMTATGGGILRLSGFTLTQEGAGQLLADGGSVELSSSARVQGGNLATANNGLLICQPGTSYLRDCTTTGRFDLAAGVDVHVEGTGLTNNGTINLNATGSPALTYLRSSISPIAHLSGTGEIVMRTSGNPTDAQMPQSYGTWSQDAGHSIHGDGTIGAQLANAGSVIADVSGRVLILSTYAKSNTGLMKAANAGILRLTGFTLTQTDAGQVLADGGSVEVTSGARVQGGAMATANDGVIHCQLPGACHLEDCTNLGRLDLDAGADVLVEGAGLTNNGTINLNATGSPTLTYLRSAIGTTAHLSGTGEIVMRTSGNPTDAQIPSYYGTWNQDPGHTIRGAGTISTPLVNGGSIIADALDRTLIVSGVGKTNNGLMKATGGGILDISAPLTNTGSAEAVGAGVFRASSLGPHYSAGTFSNGAWRVLEGGTMRLIGANIQTLAAEIVLDGQGANLYSDNASTRALSGLRTVTPNGQLEVRNGQALAVGSSLLNQGNVVIGSGASLTPGSSYTQQCSVEFCPTTTVDGTLLCADSVAVIGGLLRGSGLIVGDLRNNSRVDPGVFSAGVLSIQGDFRQDASGQLSIDLGGTAEGNYDRLAVSGTARLGGLLYLHTINGFQVADGDSFRIMTYGTRTGAFESVAGCPGPALCAELSYRDSSLVIVIHNIPAAGIEDQNSSPGESPIDDLDQGGALPAEIRFAGRLIAQGAVLDLDLPERADVSLTLYDLNGGQVATPLARPLPAGRHSIRVDEGSGRHGRLASGVYFATATVKMQGKLERRATRVLILH